MKALLWIRFRYWADAWKRSFTAGSTKNSVPKIVLFSFLLLYLLAAMIAGSVWFFWNLSLFVEMGLDWLYFSMAFLAGGALTLIGSVYSTQNQLYNARDNELLLAMPLRMEQICLSRVLFLLFGSAGYMLTITLPALVIYGIRFGMTASVLIGWLVVFFCMTVLCQAIACVLGWLLHLLLSKIRSKAIVSLIFMTLFLIAYFWAYSKIMANFQDILGEMAVLGADLAEIFRNLGGFFVWLGQGITGSLSSLLIILAVTAAAAVLGYFFITRTYRSSMLIRKAAESAVGRQRSLGSHTPVMAICIKECRRFFSSPVYLMNMGIGVIMLIGFGIAGIVMKPKILDTLVLMPYPMETILPLMFLGVFGFLHSTSAISAPAVSLEGKSLWILGSLPLDGWTILAGKLLFHLLAVCPISALAALVLLIVYDIAPLTGICLLVYAAACPVLCGITGLLMGTLFPRFDWLNETYPCKQSAAVLFTMLIQMGITLLSCGLYVLCAFVASSVLLGALAAALAVLVLTAVLYRILRKSRKMDDILRQ